MALAATPSAPIFVVADDHPMVRDALALSLGAAFPGAQIEFAGSLGETLAAVERRPDADLVLLDLDMPGMNGMSGLAQLRASYASVPVAIVSAARSPALMRQAVEMGAAGFIPKFTPSPEITDAIRDILAGAVWLPEVAPSDNLVRAARKATSEPAWRSFERRYRAEMRRPSASHLLDLLSALSHETDLAVGCYCENESRCHRSILRRLLEERGAAWTS